MTFLEAVLYLGCPICLMATILVDQLLADDDPDQ